MSAALWLQFAAATVAMLLLPGPTILLVMALAVNHGRRVVPALLAGVAVGAAGGVVLALAGGLALLAADPPLFHAVQWAAVAYLVWLGLRLMRSRPGAADPVAPTRAIFRQTVTVTLLNPKYLAFHLAVLPAFLPAGPGLLPAAALLALSFTAMAVGIVGGYILLAHRMRPLLRKPGAMLWFNRIGGAVLIGLALLLALLRHA